MKIDQRLAVFAAVAGGIVLGAAVASGVRRIRDKQQQAKKQHRKVELHEWEGEGGNLAPTPAPVVAAL